MFDDKFVLYDVNTMLIGETREKQWSVCFYFGSKNFDWHKCENI